MNLRYCDDVKSYAITDENKIARLEGEWGCIYFKDIKRILNKYNYNTLQWEFIDLDLFNIYKFISLGYFEVWEDPKDIFAEYLI